MENWVSTTLNMQMSDLHLFAEEEEAELRTMKSKQCYQLKSFFVSWRSMEVAKNTKQVVKVIRPLQGLYPGL